MVDDLHNLGTNPVPYEQAHWEYDENGIPYIWMKDKIAEEENRKFGRMLIEKLRKKHDNDTA
jgi:hypothetical protein